jgi:hypothetical protein
MTYWHMQLHPDDKNFNREREILEQTHVIGLGAWLEGTPQISQFEDEMEIGDIVLIRLGGKSIALVEVTGEFEKVESVNKDLDWFPNRRKIKVIDFMEEQRHDFPSPRGTLKKSVNRYTPTYQYINDWYNQAIDPDSNRKGLNIRKIFIDSHKIFSDIQINLVDKDGKSQPIIIIAGINGSGKTTLLEYIANFDTTPTFDKKDHVDIDLNGENLTIYKDSKKKQTNGITDFKNGVIYLPIDFGNIDN